MSVMCIYIKNLCNKSPYKLPWMKEDSYMMTKNSINFHNSNSSKNKDKNNKNKNTNINTHVALGKGDTMEC